MVTSRGFDEAKLGINPNQWADFLNVVAEAATVWPTKHHRDMVLKLCEQSKAEICFGLEGQEVVLPANLSLGATASPVEAFHMASGCPFSGKSGGQCPFSGKSDGPAPLNTILGAEGRCLLEIAADAKQAPMAGRVLDSSLQRSLDVLLEEDPDLCCPVSLMIFVEPVRASDGFIYEKSMLMQLLQNRQRSPMTREVLKSEYQVASEKMVEVMEFRRERSAALLKFALQAAAQQPQLATIARERATDYIPSTLNSLTLTPPIQIN